jgi:hypothetical protein
MRIDELPRSDRIEDRRGGGFSVLQRRDLPLNPVLTIVGRFPRKLQV